MNTEIELDLDLTPLYKVLDEKNEEVVKYIESEVKAQCPVDTGAMKASVGSTTNSHEGIIYVDTEYAAYTEYKPNTTCSGWFTHAIESARKGVSEIWHKTR